MANEMGGSNPSHFFVQRNERSGANPARFFVQRNEASGANLIKLRLHVHLYHGRHLAGHCPGIIDPSTRTAQFSIRVAGGSGGRVDGMGQRICLAVRYAAPCTTSALAT